MSSAADIVIYGGAAGGGKSRGLLMEAARYSYIPGFSAVIFRQTYGDITNPGGLWDDSYDVYPYLGARPKQSALRWDWNSGAKVVFSHFQHEKYKSNWQGAQVPLIGWDELTHFSRSIFFYMLSRNRSTCGVRPYIRCTCNPDPDSWVREFIDWWIDKETGYPIPERDGVIRWFVRVNDEIIWGNSPEELPQVDGLEGAVLPRSVCFIAAKLSDNPALVRKDPGYMANLMALPLHERERLLGGNWNIKPAAGMYFKKNWFEIKEECDSTGIVVRYWDRAATEPSEQNPDPDYTVGLRLRRTVYGKWDVEDVVRERLRPEGVLRLIKNVASQDGLEVTQVLEEDPGQAGKAELAMLKRELDQFSVDSVPAKTARNPKAGKQSIPPGSTLSAKEIGVRPVSSAAEAGNVRVIRGPWNRAFFNEAEGFPLANHDDQMDALGGAYNYISVARRSPGIRLLSS